MFKISKKILRLDLNENTLGEFPYIRPQEYLRAIQSAAKYAQVAPVNLFLTNGSTHALELIFSFFFRDNSRVLLPTPTFTFYTKFEKAKRLRFIKLPYRKNFSPDTILKSVKPGIAGLYLANPNNPLGYQFSKREMLAIIKKAARVKTVIVVDEAYVEFSGVTVKNLVNRFSNLIVVGSFSKAFGWAGLRLGYVIANKKLIAQLEWFRGQTLTLNRPGMKRLSRLNRVDLTRMKKQVAHIVESREQFTRFCEKNKISYWPSSANFVSIKAKNAPLVAKKLAREGILIKAIDNNCLRITMPPPEKLTTLTKALLRAISQ